MGAGCVLIAYSPIAAIIVGYTARRSALLVLTIARCIPQFVLIRRLME